MKLIFKILIVHCSLFIVQCHAQDTLKKAYKMPDVKIKGLDGKTFSTANITNNGKPVIISFWASWCKSCIKELSAINEVYSDWQSETGVKLIAVSTDDARTKANVMPLISGKGWEYDFYYDENSDLRRALNISVMPHTFILNGKNEIVWQHTSYTEGDEKEIYKILKKFE